MSVIIRNRKHEVETVRTENAEGKRPVVRREIGCLAPEARPSDTQKPRGRSVPKLEATSRDARLQEVEDRLLAKMLATHPNREHALDRLLHDVLDESHEPTTPPALPLKGAACISHRRRQTEDLLIAAVIESHPNAEQALDRLAGDLWPELPAPTVEWDNDWDGLA